MKELIVGLLLVVVGYAIYRGYNVRFGGKTLGGDFFFEASKTPDEQRRRVRSDQEEKIQPKGVRFPARR